MKKKISYVNDQYMDYFNTNFERDFLPLYLDGNKTELSGIFSDPKNVIESELEFDYKELILRSKDSQADVENIEIIWESLKHLTPSEASNEKLWVALENTCYIDYHLDALKLISEKYKKSSIISQTTFSNENGRKRSLVINNISTLWWIAYYTVDEKAKDIFHHTKRYVTGTYRGNAVGYFSSNITNNKEITLGTLDAIYELVDEGKMKETREAYTEANKFLRIIGAVISLDSLTREEIKAKVKENLLKMNVKT